MENDAAEPSFILTAGLDDLRTAVATLGVPENVLILTADVESPNSGEGTGQIVHPSSFLDDPDFVALISFLLQAGIEIRLDMAVQETKTGCVRERVCVHPGLDEQTLRVLREIDAYRANDQERAQERAARALSSLRGSNWRPSPGTGMD